MNNFNELEQISTQEKQFLMNLAKDLTSFNRPSHSLPIDDFMMNYYIILKAFRDEAFIEESLQSLKK